MPSRLVRLLSDRWAGPAIVAATCLVVFFVPLGAAPLTDPDEGRHAEIAREILVTGNWLTPTLGFRPYHDKPILFYWLVAASMKVFGVNAWAARLPSALAASLGVALTAWWGSRYLGRLTGVVAALLLATAALYAGLGRFVLLDMVFSAWLTAAFFYGGAWCLDGRERGWPTWPFYALLSLAVLTKGPVALVLAALVFALYLWMVGLGRAWRSFEIGRGIVIVAILAGGWYAVVALLAPEYLWEFLWVHNVQRFLTGSGAHRAGSLAYLYWLPLVFLPWSLYLPLVFFHWRRSPAPPKDAARFSAVWAGAVFVFFSLSRGKLATYLLPLFAPLALVTSDALTGALCRHPLPRFVRINHRVAVAVPGLVLVAASIAFFAFLAAYAPPEVWRALLPALCLPFLLAAWRWSRRGRDDRALATMFGVTLACFIAAYPIARPVVEEVYSLERPARLIASLPAETRVLSFGTEAPTLSFYSGRLVEKAESLTDVAALLSGPSATLLLTKRSVLDELRARLPAPFYVWWRSARKKVLVGNRPPPGAGPAARSVSRRSPA